MREGGQLTAKQCLLHGTPQLALNWRHRQASFFIEEPGGLLAVQSRHGWSFIRIPGELIGFLWSGCLHSYVNSSNTAVWVLDVIQAKRCKCFEVKMDSLYWIPISSMLVYFPSTLAEVQKLGTILWERDHFMYSSTGYVTWKSSKFFSEFDKHVDQGRFRQCNSIHKMTDYTNVLLSSSDGFPATDGPAPPVSLEKIMRAHLKSTLEVLPKIWHRGRVRRPSPTSSGLLRQSAGPISPLAAGALDSSPAGVGRSIPITNTRIQLLNKLNATYVMSSIF